MAERLISVPAARSHIDAVVADPILKACMHNVLDGLPAADAVEVVRCRDCKKGHPELAPNGGVWCAKWNHIFCDAGFCSCGERRCSA